MVVSDECLLCVWEVVRSYGVWSVCLFSTELLRVHDFLFYFEACPLHFLLLSSLPGNFYLGLVNLSKPAY